MDKSHLPDVAKESLGQYNLSLDYVGMSKIAVQISVESQDKCYQTHAKLEGGVNLVSNVKGIHMSRIYQTLTEGFLNENLSFSLLRSLLEKMLETHIGMSNFAKLTLSFTHRILRSSLLSDNRGWRSYPIEIIATLNNQGQLNISLQTTITYSSTCPCSAALSRLLIKEKFINDFKDSQNIPLESVSKWLEQEENICATPHSQRSYAIVKVGLIDAEKLPKTFMDDFIDAIEKQLSTAVQAAVKREDEQEFAYLNGTNLMFSEDSARRIKHWIVNDLKQSIKNYSVRIEHHESLHEHDAIAEFYG